MGERLQQLSAGELLLRQYPSGQLGQEKDTILATMFGAVDINRINVAPLGNIATELQVLSLPYLFRDPDHMYRVLEGPIGQELLAFLEPHNMIGLAFLESGSRSFYTKKPIKNLDDLAGLKIRVQNTDLFVRMMELLGANATPMSFGQVYESLLTGVIDGAENNWPSYVSTRHFEAARYYTLDRHSMVPEVILMSKKRWEQLSQGQQDQVKQAAMAATGKMRGLWNQRVEHARATALASGVQVIDLPDTAPFRQAVEPLYQEFMRDPVLADLITRIRAEGDR